MVSAQTADCRLPTAEGEARAAVVAEARSWLGTPYHHAADVKGAGVDCAMLLVRVYCDLGLVEPFDPRPYTRDWFLHRSEERYLGFLLAHSHEVRALREGDIVLFRIGRCYGHGGIVTGTKPLTVIHAFATTRCVVEDVIARSAELSERLKTAKFASYWS
jgi:NlpC/P60 family putative phage cell wall peptidase